MQNLAPKKLRAHKIVDCPAYCWPSLGLGNTAGAEILEGDVWGALKSQKYLGPWGYDCPAYCRPSLGLGNTAGAEILEGDVWRALKSKQYVAME